MDRWNQPHEDEELFPNRALGSPAAIGNGSSSLANEQETGPRSSAGRLTPLLKSFLCWTTRLPCRASH